MVVAGICVVPVSVRLPDCTVNEPLGRVRLLKAKFIPSMTRAPLPPNWNVPPLLKPREPLPRVPIPWMVPPVQVNTDPPWRMPSGRLPFAWRKIGRIPRGLSSQKNKALFRRISL